mgnify:FL=1
MVKVLAEVTGSISFSQRGDKGQKGALMREHDGFESGSYKYLSGAGEEEYVDVVCVKGKWYQCIKTYDDDTSSPSLTDGHWIEMSNYKSIATHLLLAENATINMLGSNQINLYNPSGGAMFGSFRVVDNDDDYALWLGAAQAKDAPFRVTKDGSLYASNGIFKGELRGVKGSFQILSAVSPDEKVKAGTLSFNSDGYIDIEGDLRFQGMVNGRSGVLYGGTIYSRGAFGHRLSTFALVVGSMMYVYPFGTDYPDKREIVYLSSQQYDGKTVYNIPLYGVGNSKYSGCPIDVVAFKNNTDRSEYYYEFIPGGTGKRWMAVNIRDTNNGVYFSDVGGWHQLNGGETINLVYIQPEMLTPSQENKTYYGRGIFWSGEHDLDWSNR